MSTKNSNSKQLDIYRIPQTCRFEGDIVITDPCYFLKRAKADEVIEEPRWEDYFPRLQYTSEMLQDAEIAKEFEECNARMNAAYVKWCENNIDDSDLVEAFDNLEALGMTTFLLAKTEYGPWTCTVFNSDTGEEYYADNRPSTFTSDSGLVGVFLLNDVCRYNPHYRKVTEPCTATRLIGYKGTVSIVNYSESTGLEADIRIIGVGDDESILSFYTKQTGV